MPTIHRIDSELTPLAAAGRRGADNTSNHSQNHQTEDVVDHRCTEDDFGFLGLYPPDVLEHAGGDADRGCGESRPDEHVNVDRLRRQEPSRYAPAEEEWRYDAEDGTTTINDATPTFIISPTVDSRPTSNSRMITPSSANTSRMTSWANG